MSRSQGISPSDRVHAVLARDESLLEIFTAASPAFEKLRTPSLRKTMARLVTVEQAARIAGVDARALVERLNAALAGGAGAPAMALSLSPSPTPIPEAIRATPPHLLVDCDVREDLRAGREPLKRILQAARETPDGGVLRLRAIFEPVPLYGVLKRQGFTHHTERFAPDDWQIWFHRDGGAGASSASVSAAPPTAPADRDDDGSDETDGTIVVLDVRDLEPPEPMARTLEALSSLPKGHTLVQLNVRVPQFLIAELERRGFTWEVREQSEDLVRVFIRHADT